MCTGRKRIPGRGGVTQVGAGPAGSMAAPKTPGSILLERRWGSRKMGRGPSNLLGAVVLEGQSTKGTDSGQKGPSTSSRED